MHLEHKALTERSKVGAGIKHEVADKALPERSEGGAGRLLGFRGKPPTSSPVLKAQCIVSI